MVKDEGTESAPKLTVGDDVYVLHREIRGVLTRIQRYSNLTLVGVRENGKSYDVLYSPDSVERLTDASS